MPKLNIYLQISYIKIIIASVLMLLIEWLRIFQFHLSSFSFKSSIICL